MRALPIFLVLLLACGDDDASTDSGPADVGSVDTGSVDSGPGDSGMDAGELDTGMPDTPAAADTWTNFAEAFMTMYCVDCHDGMTGAGRDFQVLENVRAESARIRCGTSDVMLADCSSPPARQFPIGSGPHPSDADRARLVAWIDAGLPE